MVTISKTQMKTKLQNGKGDMTEKLKLWRKKYSKTQLLTKLKNLNCDKTQIVAVLKL